MKGSSAGHYYTSLAREDYFLTGGEPPGRWFGKSAIRLGLHGAVQKDDLRDLFQGYAPGRRQALVQNAGDPQRQSGWDLTFSAPKSVSVLWSQVTEDVRREIQTVHEAAVLSTLTYLERETGFTRRGKQGLKIEKVGFITALFEHGSSREQDPQLHSHALVMNLGLRDDGTTGTIVSKRIFQHKMAAGITYRLALATGLQQRLGLTLTNSPDNFEIQGVPESLIREFSKRREAIKREMVGRDGAIAAKEATLKTRRRKCVLPRKELFRQWAEVGHRLGWVMTQAMQLIGRNQRTKDPISTKDVHAAVTTLLKHESHFSLRQLTLVLMKRVLGRQVTFSDVEAAVNTAALNLIPLCEYKGERQFTSPTMLEKEHGLLHGADSRQMETGHRLSAFRVEWALRLSGLSQEQKEGVRHITCAPGGVKILSGLAGTGKSALLKVAGKQWKRARYKVLGIALSGKAAQGLEETAGIKSITLAHALKLIERTWWSPLPTVSLSVRSPLIARKAPKWSFMHGLRLPHLCLQVGNQPINHRSIVVVDEAGMVGTAQLKTLLDYCRKARAKVILVGDAKQLPAIEAGAPFRALGEVLGEKSLTDIKRQRDPWAREVVASFAQGDTRTALTELRNHGAIHVSPSHQRPEELLMQDWIKTKDPKQNIIMAVTNDEVRQLNAYAHEERRKHGGWWKKELHHNGERISAGDRVIFGKRSKIYGVVNGTFGTVKAVGRKRLLVRIDGKKRKTVVIPLMRFPHVRLGYAITTSKAQGITVENSFVFLGGTRQSRELAYVEASRARGTVNFYLNSEVASSLDARINRSDKKVMALDLVERHPRTIPSADKPRANESSVKASAGGDAQWSQTSERSQRKPSGRSGRSQSQSRTL